MNSVKRQEKTEIISKFYLSNLLDKSFDNFDNNFFLYSARIFPFCSISTIRLPISQYVAVKIALTDFADRCLASSNKLDMPFEKIH